MTQEIINNLRELYQHSSHVEPAHHNSFFKNTIHACGIELDLTSQVISNSVFFELIQIATQANLKAKIDSLFNGHKLNFSKHLPALHTSLRSNFETKDKSISKKVKETYSSMYKYVSELQKDTSGNTRQITDIVNVGIGGSDLGPRMALEALAPETTDQYRFHFISDCDPDSLEKTLSKLNPKTTIFIICSKSFLTTETIDNMHAISAWAGQKNYKSRNFVAVTANIARAKEHGIEKIFKIWPWVGGRFSFCSAVNLILMIAIGERKFKEVLRGAADMDMHVKFESYYNNLAIMLALVDILNINGRKATNRAVLTFSNRLNILVPYIQQLEMESNGKMTNIFGEKVPYATSGIVWGGPGNQAQHAYFQLLCQGTHLTPCDLIYIKTDRYKKLNQHVFHMVNTFKNAGKFSKIFKPCVPFTQISLDDITPYSLGALVSLYEHKVFIQSIIWNINAFDQPGVDYAKQLSSYCT